MNIFDFKKNMWIYTRKINENTNKAFYPICEQYGLTMLQVRILMELYQYGFHTIGSLANSIDVAGANISAMCKKLERSGFLERTRDKKDERVVMVILTEKGNEIVVEIIRAIDVKISQHINGETEETLEAIILGLEKLNDLLLRISSDEK